MLCLFWNTEKSSKRFTLQEEILRAYIQVQCLVLKGEKIILPLVLGSGFFWDEEQVYSQKSCSVLMQCLNFSKT